MRRPELPPDLRRFIATSIPSVPYLEAVLLLRAEPSTAWTASTMARRLYLPEADAARLLADAAEAGMAQVSSGTQDPIYGYAPSTPELAQVLDRLAAHYAVDLVTVTDLIHSKVEKRAQQFADGFRWRKDT
ncbi:hypothetical protein JI739_01345 [Ramlibacter sp. AW1]|uniref:Uncharacterized protein n=1 Tax=Ramlibacter aurantiacus TaxID=2801330 RepID=A0A936ZQS4_9BURK|nr:hypothetical protein [Ramlibacter aurantiacus]MBL0418979.1 hypothetical protein [Ramlibacter aurantiacus]